MLFLKIISSVKVNQKKLAIKVFIVSVIILFLILRQNESTFKLLFLKSELEYVGLYPTN